jgi:hypothetical protein
MVTEVATESPARSAPRPTWNAFEQALSSALSVLADESLIVTARVGNRNVQFHACPDEGVLCESVSNAYLDPAPAPPPRAKAPPKRRGPTEFAKLRANVHPDEKFLARMHEVNSCLPMVRVIYRGGSVFLGVDFHAVPFRPEHLAQAVTAIAQLADAVLKDIRAPGDDAAATVVN